ncbi:hypothetical protein D3C83_218930 [compost metagenome]
MTGSHGKVAVQVIKTPESGSEVANRIHVAGSQRTGTGNLIIDTKSSAIGI